MQALTGFPKGNGSIPFEYRPNLGPSIAAEAKADAPPEIIQQLSNDRNVN